MLQNNFTKQIHFAAFVLMSLCIGCKKPERVRFTIPEALKQVWNFQVGSYWVYREEVSGREDSFYVVSNVSEFRVSSSSLLESEEIDILTNIVNTSNNTFINDDLSYRRYAIYSESEYLFGLGGGLKFLVDQWDDTRYKGAYNVDVNGIVYPESHLFVSYTDSTYLKFGVGVIAQYRYNVNMVDTTNKRRYTLLRHFVKIK